MRQKGLCPKGERSSRKTTQWKQRKLEVSAVVREFVKVGERRATGRRRDPPPRPLRRRAVPGRAGGPFSCASLCYQGGRTPVLAPPHRPLLGRRGTFRTRDRPGRVGRDAGGSARESAEAELRVGGDERNGHLHPHQRRSRETGRWRHPGPRGTWGAALAILL